ncbi:MAG: hypothetical protein WCC11_04525 [Gammaproteobacteria bacterium]
MIGLSAIGNAYAICEPQVVAKPATSVQPNTGCQPPNPNPVPFSQQYSWGTATGTAHPATGTSSGAVSTSSVSPIPGQVDFKNEVITGSLPHSEIQITKLVNNGSVEFKFYVYTMSSYAPNGDSGTFVLDTNGNFIEGTAADWSRLQQEVTEADPEAVSNAEVVYSGFGDWFDSHATQIRACANLTTVAALNVALFASGPMGAVAALGADWAGEDAIDEEMVQCF